MRNLAKTIACTLGLAFSATAMATSPAVKVETIKDSSTENKSVSGAKLLRINEETVHGVTISLPVTLELNNNVCVRYISTSGVSTSITKEYEKIDVTVKSFCDEAVDVDGILYPKGLVSMEWVEKSGGGGVHQLETVHEFKASKNSSTSATTSDAVTKSDK